VHRGRPLRRAAEGLKRVVEYSHDLYGFALELPGEFFGAPDLARSFPDVLSAWHGDIGDAFVTLVLQALDAAETATVDDAGAKRIVDSMLIAAQCSAVERSELRWHDHTLGVIVGATANQAYAIVDVPLIAPGALRIRIHASLARRDMLVDALRSVLAALSVTTPEPD
jgi:hypothetical protein